MLQLFRIQSRRCKQIENEKSVSISENNANSNEGQCLPLNKAVTCSFCRYKWLLENIPYQSLSFRRAIKDEKGKNFNFKCTIPSCENNKQNLRFGKKNV